jgi:hypothetical protein
MPSLFRKSISSPFSAALIAPALLAAMLATAAAAAEDYAQWTHFSELYMDTSPDGANVSADVVNFPVLVRLKGPDFPFAQARGQGQDLRFSKPDGTHLDFEIERWDSAGQAADIWVRIDTVKGGFKGRFARMHWGNTVVTGASAPGNVFQGSNGFVSVWHLGGKHPIARPNSVAGGLSAIPVNYDEDESCAGVIGLADSLDGNATGDYLSTYDSYSNVNAGFTFSVWAYPAAASVNARILDFGNGSGSDNIILSTGAPEDLYFDSYNPGKSEVLAKGAVVQNQWQYFAVTVWGTTANIYRNGALLASGALTNPISGNARLNNYLGKSNWASDPYFKGKIDEPVVAKSPRSADWIKLSYANQKPAQNLVSFTPPPASCAAHFAAPSDTAMPEGGAIDLSGTADCAVSYLWAALSGPAPRILDPEVKSLHVYLPRVTADTSILYRFSANFGNLVRTKDVAVRVKETIPDPVLAMPTALVWNGIDSLLLKPVITNIVDVRASGEPVLHYAWELSGLNADTIWRSGALMLKSSLEQGSLKVGLCIDNGGTPACKSTNVIVSRSTGLAAQETAQPAPETAVSPSHRAWDVSGRFVPYIKRNRRVTVAQEAGRADVRSSGR